MICVHFSSRGKRNDTGLDTSTPYQPNSVRADLVTLGLLRSVFRPRSNTASNTTLNTN
jgi:hypothetical protein